MHTVVISVSCRRDHGGVVVARVPGAQMNEGRLLLRVFSYLVLVWSVGPFCLCSCLFDEHVRAGVTLWIAHRALVENVGRFPFLGLDLE